MQHAFDAIAHVKAGERQQVGEVLDDAVQDNIHILQCDSWPKLVLVSGDVSHDNGTHIIGRWRNAYVRDGVAARVVASALDRPRDWPVNDVRGRESFQGHHLGHGVSECNAETALDCGQHCSVSADVGRAG